MSNHKEPYSARVLRHRKLVVSVWVVLAVVGAWAASSINDHLSHSFDAPGRPAFEANKQIVGHYGNGGVIAPFVLVADPRGSAAGRRGPSSSGRPGGSPRRSPARAWREPGDGGPNKAFESADGKVAYALVFPPIGPEAPDKNEAALAAPQKAARGAAGRRRAAAGHRHRGAQRRLRRRRRGPPGRDADRRRSAR